MLHLQLPYPFLGPHRSHVSLYIRRLYVCGLFTTDWATPVSLEAHPDLTHLPPIFLSLVTMRRGPDARSIAQQREPDERRYRWRRHGHGHIGRAHAVCEWRAGEKGEKAVWVMRSSVRSSSGSCSGSFYYKRTGKGCLTPTLSSTLVGHVYIACSFFHPLINPLHSHMRLRFTLALSSLSTLERPLAHS